MHGNISVFIPHMGCPHDCSFCNQRTISSTARAPSPDEAEEIIKGAYEYMSPDKKRQTEIAFFGGSFTAIEREYMTALLERAEKYTGEQGFCGIRISTRPDCIDEEILILLKDYGVTAIELGAQSMDDKVLSLNNRGHCADDVRNASALIKAHGFELGLQIMAGLYGSTPEKELYTLREAIKCAPHTARIYPVAVLEGTALEKLYRAGKYTLYPFDECVRLCAMELREFTNAGIRVIRIGLHAEESVGARAVAGFYHPAFGELVRSELAASFISEALSEKGEVLCEAPPSMMSIAAGHKKSNRIRFAGQKVAFIKNENVPKRNIRINGRDIYIG